MPLPPRWIFLFALIAAAAPSRASASMALGPVLGLMDRFQLVVEEFGEAGRPCGLDREGLRQSFAASLAESPLKIADGPDDLPAIYIRATTLIVAGTICVTSINAEIDYWTKARFGHLDLPARTMLWQDGAEISSAIDQHAGRMQAHFEKMGKALLVDWSAARLQLPPKLQSSSP